MVICDLSEVDIVVSKSNCLWNLKIMLIKQTTIVINKWDSTSYWNGLVFLKSINSEPITMKSLLSEKFFNKFTQTSYKLNSKKSSLILHLSKSQFSIWGGGVLVCYKIKQFLMSFSFLCSCSKISNFNITIWASLSPFMRNSTEMKSNWHLKQKIDKLKARSLVANCYQPQLILSYLIEIP